MAEYNVDIAIAVKNREALKAFKRELTEIQEAADKLSNTNPFLSSGAARGDAERKNQQIFDAREKAAKAVIEGLEDLEMKSLDAKSKREQQLDDALLRDKLAAIEAETKAEEKRSKEAERLEDKEFKQRLENREIVNKEINKQVQAIENASKVYHDGEKKLEQITTDTQIKNDEIVQQRRLEDIKELEKAELDAGKRLMKQETDDFNMSRDRRRKAQKDEEKAAKESSRKMRKRFNAAVTGGAFPLLFGGGPLQALGGAIGGGISGEMFSGATVGLQVLGSAIQGLVVSSSQLGQALNPLTADIDAIASASGFASTETAEYLKTIEKLGSEHEALEIATALLATTVGQEGVDALKDFGEGSLELSNEFSRAMSLMSADIAKLLGGATRGIAVAMQRTNDLQAGLRMRTPEALKIQKQLARLATEREEKAARTGSKTDAVVKSERELELEDKLRGLARQNRIEAEKKAKAQALGLENQKLLTKFKIEDRHLQVIINDMAGMENDLTDKKFASLSKAKIERERELKIAEAVASATDKETKKIEDQGRLAIIKRQINEDFNNEQKALDRDIIKAEERKAQQLDKNSEKEGKKLTKLTDQNEKIQKRISVLNGESSLLEKNLEIEDKITQAKINQDEETVVRLQLEKKINDISEKTRQALEDAEDAGVRAALKDKDRALKEQARNESANKMLLIEAQRAENYKDLMTDLDHELKVKAAVTEVARTQLEIEQRIKELQGDDPSLTPDQIEEYRQKLEDLLSPKTGADAIRAEIGAVQDALDELTDPGNQVIALASTIGEAFSESFKGIISGSMTAREALANLFQRTADHFLDMAAQMIAAQMKMQLLNIGLNFFGGGVGRVPTQVPQMTKNAIVTPTGFSGQFGGFAANGGPVTGGNSYIVGERGPELFVPGAKGNIVPNNAMGGGASVTVNVDASGSSVEGDGNQAAQLGKAIGIAVQQELIKQKRPGGLLTR